MSRWIAAFLSLAILIGVSWKVHAATRIVGQGQVYTTIQDAVNASVDDDTIVVKSGTYSENVTVNKRLSILSETGYESTSVTSKNGLVVFTINADYVNLKGFAISGSSQAAVYLQKGADHAIVSSNRIYDSGIGVELNEASHNRIENNLIQNTGQGIKLYNYSGLGVSNNNIHKNTISSSNSGISFYEANANLITDNMISEIRGVGIDLYVMSNFNTISGNTITGSNVLNSWGIRAQQISNYNIISSNEVRFFSNGIVLSGNSFSSIVGNLVSHNTLSSNGFGMHLGWATSNILAGNTCSSNSYGGIDLISGSNVLVGNSLRLNEGRGLWIRGNVLDNILYFNKFDNHGSTSKNIDIDSMATSSNSWNFPLPLAYGYNQATRRSHLGNYYSNHSLLDSDGDGIADFNYDLPGSEPDAAYCLASSPENFSLNVWWLEKDAKLYPFDGNKGHGLSNLPGSSSVIWIADEPAKTEIFFSGGYSWVGQVMFAQAPPANSMLIEIGHSSDGNNFTPGGPQKLIGDGSSLILYYITSSASFTVPTGRSLAVRLTNYTGIDHSILLGYGVSFVSPALFSCTAATFYRDQDGDGYGDAGISQQGCFHPPGYVGNNLDCDDNNADAHPNQTWYRDLDGDNYSNGISTQSCQRPAGYKLEKELISTTGDCNDDKPLINPGATEICNNVDDNCDGQIDEGVTTRYYRDADLDSFGDPEYFIQACKKPSGYVLNTRDCNDNDPFEYPGQTWYLDADGDGYSDGTANSTSCPRPVGYRAVSELIKISGDCNDSDPSQFPNQVWFRDSDGDGFGDSNKSIKSCKKPSGYILNRRDCDDSNPAIFPGHGCPNALPAIIELLLE